MKVLTTAAFILAGFVLALPDTATAHHDRDWQHCIAEDGSGQKRCIWDAKHSGNGEGHSVMIRRGGTDSATYTLISHKRAKHLLGDNH